MPHIPSESETAVEEQGNILFEQGVDVHLWESAVGRKCLSRVCEVTADWDVVQRMFRYSHF